MPQVFSVVTLKGGVGKTTSAVALAEACSAEFGKRVLLVDLDPQTNATVMLIGVEAWKSLNDEGRTLATLFRDAAAGREMVNIREIVQRDVSGLSAARSIDLLPSSPDLADVLEQLHSADERTRYANSTILARALQPHLDSYDVVIMDCPPNLGPSTLNGLMLSDGFVIPTIPDFLSTHGIPQILARTETFANAAGRRVAPLGVLVTKYQKNSPVHRSVLEELRNRPDYPPVFETVIPQAAQVASAAEYKGFTTFKQKWGYDDLAASIIRLAREIFTRLGEPSHASTSSASSS